MAVFDPGRARSLFAMAEDIIGDRVAPLTFQHELALARVKELEDRVKVLDDLLLCHRRDIGAEPYPDEREEGN